MGDLTNDLTLQEVLANRPEPKRILTTGLEGHDVALLQAALRRLGLPVGTIDGKYGDKTHAAVKAFCDRAGLAFSGSVDAALWAAILRAADEEHAKALALHAGAHEQLAALHHAAAEAAQQVARDKRTQGQPAGEDEEKAADALLQAARVWFDAAAAWLVAAHRTAVSHEAYARHLRALAQGREHAVRAANSYTLAGKDYTGAGQTGHELRMQAAIVAARELAAR